jgi:aspartokinase-like uncharacterized kinase
MWVAKIGGSVAGAASLAHWLAAFCEDTTRRWLLVPGGGSWADLVRASQRRWGYSDVLAHGMAMQAMALYGSELGAIEPRLRRCDSLPEALGSAGGWPRLWRPALSDVAALTEVPADWRASADSLALALARRAGAEGLLLLKSVAPAAGARSAVELAACGWVDDWLPVMMGGGEVPVYWACRDEVPLSSVGESRRLRR